MRVRHRIPSIFSLSMVDVLCCALGCVILLWLMNLRVAREHEDEAAQQKQKAARLLEDTQAQRDQVAAQLRKVSAERDEAYGRYYTLEKEFAVLKQVRDDLRSKIEALASRLEASKQRNQTQMTRSGELAQKLEVASSRLKALQALADLVPDLQRRLRRADVQMKDLKATADLVPGLRDDLKKVQGQYAAAATTAQSLRKEMALRLDQLKDAGRSLEGLRAARKTLERDVANRDKELAAALAYRERAEAAEKELATEKKRLAVALRSVASLEGDKKQLQGEVGKMRAVVDNRFAGITLTGRRVVFLVDMSGSMRDVAEKTPAPGKWKEVARTVSKLMISLPNLQKYQVILFAEQISYPLGGATGWLDHDAATTPEKVEKALLQIKPDGGTNMYSGLRAAFRLRNAGLDTIYLLSDGLPSEGEPLTAEEAATRPEAERNVILSRYIRKTLKTDWNRPLANRPRVKINAIGFFYESPEVGAFLWALARENEGSFVGMSKP
jgi:uncharacterized coiled-coil DUF342 family protein